MKSSVRILAIALALAFLLLARTAFQDSPASAAAIDLDDGEASFADLIDGTQEAEYIGFRGKATTSVYFYIESSDLGTQVTTRTTHLPNTIVAADTSTSTLVGTDPAFTLRGGRTGPASIDEMGTTTGRVTTLGDLSVDSASTTVATGLDLLYCETSAAITDFVVVYAGGESYTRADDAETTINVVGWGVASTTDDAPGGCASGDPRAETDRKAISDSERNRLATAALADIRQLNTDEENAAKDANALLYSYKSGNTYVAATSTNPDRRYTNQMLADPSASPATRDTVGGATKPLSSVVFRVMDSEDPTDPPADDRTTNIPTFESDNAGGEFRLAYDLSTVTLAPYTDREFVVDVTFDIVDVYEHDQSAKRASDPYAMYTSGFKRAYVSSGSDQGVWVTIREVVDETDNMMGVDSPTSNLFQGMVEITNDASKNTPNNVYAQDGDTLTLQVYDENDNRSSDVIASATAIIDGSEPTITDLSPADGDIISDDTLQISFSVNDEGAGVDFREVDEKKVVTMIQAQARDESLDTTHKGTGTPCLLAGGNDYDDIGNAGGNASRVGVLVSPRNTDYTDRCADVVDTTTPSNNGHGKKFNLIITSEDLAGNVDTHTTQLTIDTVKPRLHSNPGVGQAWNADDNKAKSSANSILVRFTESLAVDTVSKADFTVAGYTIDSIEVVGTNEDDGEKHLNEFVVLTLTEDLANDARPSVTVSGVSDVAGNMIEKFTSESDNKIKAKVTVVPFSALVAEKGEQAISFTADEAIFAESGGKNTQASVNGRILSVKVAGDTMGGSATFKQNTYRSDGSRAFGVIIRAVDANGNNTDVGAVSVDDEDHKLEADLATGQSVPLDNWPPADSDLNKSFAGEVKAYVGDIMVASSTNDVDWKKGTIKLAVNAGVDSNLIEKDDTITLKYKYVKADQVIQVDVDAPEMRSIPADNDETDNAGGAIQFVWSDSGWKADSGADRTKQGAGEYAGDTYKTVTLNSAMHEGPSGTSTDILDALTTHDSKTWVYTPAEDLAIGDHEFTVKATDAAGNSNEVSITITITERKPVEIGLRVGWNLISFPGMPKSTDVNDIFTSDTISVVSQYDGRRVSPFTVWTRGEDGSLSSSPAGRMSIDSGLGLWVLSTDGSPLEVVTQRDDVTQVPPSIDLIPGWNLVAVILIGDRKSVGVNEYLPDGAWTRAFRLNNTTGQFDSFSPPAPSTTGEPAEAGDPLMAGEALWVYVTKAATIVPK